MGYLAENPRPENGATIDQSVFLCQLRTLRIMIDSLRIDSLRDEHGNDQEGGNYGGDNFGGPFGSLSPMQAGKRP
jgi:hypothetical protein